jgi:hypothetical protein
MGPCCVQGCLTPSLLPARQAELGLMNATLLLDLKLQMMIVPPLNAALDSGAAVAPANKIQPALSCY